MPRQVDSSLLNAGVNNDPNSTISSGNVNNILASGKAGIPSLTPQFFLNGIFNLLTQIAKATGIDLTSPQAFFTSLVTMILHGGSEVLSFIEAVLQPLIDELISLLGGIPIIGGVIQTLANFLGLTHTTANMGVTNAAAAQVSANSNATGLAILNARVDGIIIGGTTYSDTFSRSGSGLGSDYTLKYGAGAQNLDNSGSGTVGTDTANSGTTVWTPVGYAERTWVAINNVNPMTTNRSRVSVVVSPFSFGGAGNEQNLYLIARADATLGNFIMARIGNLDVSGPGTCEVGYVKAGVYTRFGSVVGGLDLGHNDLWDLEAGTATDDDQFRLLQNNALRVDVTDLGHDAHKDTVPGTTYMYTGTGEDTGIGAGPFGITFQQPPPNIQVLAAADF